MITCKHYRYLIPNEDANELRDADEEFCLVCDSIKSLRKMRFFAYDDIFIRKGLDIEPDLV